MILSSCSSSGGRIHYVRSPSLPSISLPNHFHKFFEAKESCHDKNVHPWGEENLYSPSVRHPNRCLWNNIIQRTVPQNPTNLRSKFFLVTKLWNAWLPLIYKINVLERTSNARTSTEWQALYECLTKRSICQAKPKLSSNSFLKKQAHTSKFPWHTASYAAYRQIMYVETRCHLSIIIK